MESGFSGIANECLGGASAGNYKHAIGRFRTEQFDPIPLRLEHHILDSIEQGEKS